LLPQETFPWSSQDVVQLSAQKPAPKPHHLEKPNLEHWALSAVQVLRTSRLAGDVAPSALTNSGMQVAPHRIIFTLLDEYGLFLGQRRAKAVVPGLVTDV